MAAALQSVDPIRKRRHHDTDTLGAEITELCAYIFAATYKLLVLIREFDRQGGWQQPGLCSCAHWLNFKCGIGMNAAREKVRVAHALAGLPGISAAFERGELSYSKVRAMTRIANNDNEDYLLMIANHGTAYHMEKLVQKFRRAERLQDADAENRKHRERYLQHYFDEDGCLVINARLPAEQGALVVKALEKAMDDRFKHWSEDHLADRSEDRAEDRLDEPSGVSAETSITQLGSNTTISNPPRVSAETSEKDCEPDAISARRADALAEVAETYLNGGSESATSADRYQVVVHVSAETSATLLASATYIENGPRVSAETSRRLGCDCSLLRLTENADGEPLSIGRKSRSIPPAIRRALRFRDLGCRFPGCTNTRFVDGHHIHHWADGGETSLDNLVQLCRHHHRLVHEGGYECERTASGELLFTAPDRGRLPEFSKLRAVDEDPYEHFEREMREFDIGQHTCVAEYYAGDRIDWDLAVAALTPIRQ